MTKKEIEKNIAKEESRIERLKDRIKSIKFDIRATRKAISFWKKELKNCEK